MKPKLLISTIAIVCLSAFTLAPPELQIADGYSIRFKGKKVNGFFHKLTGKVSFDENKISAASCNLEVEVASITTGNSLKSWHAKRPKWFDAKNHPTITFVSEKFVKTDKGYVVNGKLKMHGVEKQVTVPFKYSGNIFFGQFYVKRTDYGIGSMKGFSKMVSDSIKIEFTIPVTK